MLVDMEELPRDVAGVLVVKRGVTVLWLVVDVDVSVGTVTEFVTTLKVVSALWVVGEDGMLFVVVSEGSVKSGAIPDWHLLALCVSIRCVNEEMKE